MCFLRILVHWLDVQNIIMLHLPVKTESVYETHYFVKKCKLSWNAHFTHSFLVGLALRRVIVSCDKHNKNAYCI